MKAKKFLVESLSESLGRTISRVNSRNLISKIALVYDRGQGSILPPVLGVLFADHESVMRSTMEGDDLAESLWNPAEFSEYGTDQLRPELDGEIMREIEEVNVACNSNEKAEDEVVEVLQSISVSLTKKIQSETGNAAALVFPTDSELSELRRNVETMRQSCPRIPFDIPSWCQ